MPKVKLGSKDKPKKPLTKLEKAEIRAAKMVDNEEQRKKADIDKRYKECIEYKMLKGHSKEIATKMAKELIYQESVING